MKTELELSSAMPEEQATLFCRFKTIKMRGEARAYIETVRAKVALARLAHGALNASPGTSRAST